MPYLTNQSGRIVAVPQEDYDYLLTLEGFSKPSETEIATFEEDYRQRAIAAVEKPRGLPNELKIYLATVTQGGKDGYGVASHFLIKELNKLGINITPTNEGQKIAMLFHNPYSILRLEAPYRMIYTMFESDKIPEDWIDYLHAADKVIVPSKWCRDVFAKSGINTTVIPLGYDSDTFTYKKRPDKRKSRKDFTFLHYNAFNVRKGFLEVFKAFIKAFPPEDHEPVKMIFKTTLNESRLPITKEEYPNIDIQLGKISDKELAQLCHESDAFVFPSRGEGFGMTPLEAMATGLPTIVPNAHGISEYFNEDYMYEAKVASKCPAIYARYKGESPEDTIEKFGEMVVCDVDQMAKQMRYIYEHQDEAAAKGLAASEYVKQWTFKKSAEKLKDLFLEVNKINLEDRPARNKLRLEVVR